MAEKRYLRFTEHSNALDSLRRAVQFLEGTKSDESIWKWVTIALHDALYGFSICACQGTDPSHLMSKANPDFLRGFDAILEKCQTPNGMYPFGECRPLKLNPVQKRRIRFLKAIRDDFAHFSPKGWSIDLCELIQSSHEALVAIRFIVVESGAHFAYSSIPNDEARDLLETAIRLVEESSKSDDCISKMNK